MNPESANVLILDCGTMVGHQQTELELPKTVIPFFGVAPTGSHSLYIRAMLSNGISEYLRMIYRPDNGMWRVELTSNVPEVGSLFPRDSRRSNCAAIFKKIVSEDIAEYQLSFVEIDTPDYESIFSQAAHKDRTRTGSEGRRYGWH